MNPDRLAQLEEERKFLLRSLRDIEREHEAGDIDATDFATLRDGYIARAGAVLREIEDGRSSLIARPQRPWYRRLAVVGGTLLVAVALGVYVASSAGQRLEGQSLTGGKPADEVAIQLANARQTMGSDPIASLKSYARVLEIEPQNVEAITYSAWLKVLAGQAQGDQQVVLDALPDLQQAIDIDPTYADAHCFLAVASGRFLTPPDKDTGVREGMACLEANPPAMLKGQIEQLVSELTLGDLVDTVPATDPTTT
jgi:tetratricopeptide (TPR) repeat protein